MTRPTLPAGVIPVGATHFYFDPGRRTPVNNPWRRLDADGTWHMLRGGDWIRIAGSNRHRFFLITDTLQPHYAPAEELTLRDYFAARAMQGMLTSLDSARLNSDVASSQAYAIADDMLKAREVQS